MRFGRITAVLSALTLLTGSMAAYPASAAAKGSGDIDENGRAEIADAILLARWLAEDTDITVTAQGLLNADLTGDGQVTTDDSAKLLRLLAGADDDDLPPAERRSVDLLADVTPGNVQKGDPSDAAFRKAQSKFSADLLRQLQADEQDKNKNLLVSPVSVSLALGMTVNGAKGDTLAEMQKVLGDDLTAEQLNAYYAGWSDQLLSPREQREYRYDDNGDSYVTSVSSSPVTLANAIWIRDDEDLIHVPEQFLQTTADYYRAGAYKAPFDQTTVKEINSWCDENTHHMIPEVIQALAPEDIMVLANALTFEDAWKTIYEEYFVRDGRFTAANGESRDVKMMFSNEDRYISDGTASGFIKPYRDPRYSFAAVLPNEDVSLDDYIASLDGEKLTKLLDSKESCLVEAAMPKFKFDYSVTMNDALKALGMPAAFLADTADFTGLNDAEGIKTWIGKVIHKTHIDVSETGTKAAAVTAVIMAGGCGIEPEVKTVTLDRPFLFMILDNQTDLPIFIGTVKDIQAE